MPNAEVSLNASSSYAHNTNTAYATSSAVASLSYQWSLINHLDGSNPVIYDRNVINPRLKTDMTSTYRLKLEVSTQDGSTNSTEVDPKYQGPNIQSDFLVLGPF